jgi:hypothetical protein
MLTRKASRGRYSAKFRSPLYDAANGALARGRSCFAFHYSTRSELYPPSSLPHLSCFLTSDHGRSEQYIAWTAFTQEDLGRARNRLALIKNCLLKVAGFPKQ